ncbi:alpha/beta hydrolase family protein [Saccharothrix syringae]|uniref:alpha/beta hydrolase family protein n=1 Tax=Saccharothrix syringae TaxID=103733 RepID=UPI000526B37D|nr:alpha/beta fold hydrolase [Saccharothrix syringae]
MSPLVTADLSRATGAGLDPHEYLRRTEGVTTARDWLDACAGAGEEYLRRAAAATSPVTAAEYRRLAARWFHFATLCPSLDRDAWAGAAARADEAMGLALGLGPDNRAVGRSPGPTNPPTTARRLSGPLFTGWLRGPADPVATVVVVPGLDSSKEEFHLLAEALLRRGAAVLALDGPGQGVLAPTTRVRADYHHVVDQAVTALGVDRVGLVGLSLGGYYAAEAAAHDTRVAATVTVSGPFRLAWPDLPPLIREVLTVRAGGAGEAESFADRVDLTDLAPRITTPLLVVDGGRDVIPGVTNGEPLARLAPAGDHLRVDHGDHLLGNARPDWLPVAADWLLDRLAR